MDQRRLGSQGLAVSAMGLGCMGMSDAYGPAADGESVATIHRALDLGVNLLDMSDAYGPRVTRVTDATAARAAISAAIPRPACTAPERSAGPAAASTPPPATIA